MMPDRCLLCGTRKLFSQALFVPNAEFARKLDVPAEKLRTYFYALCSRCYRLPDRDERVDQTFLVRARAARQ